MSERRVAPPGVARGYVELDRVWKRFRYGEVHDSLRDLIPAFVRGVFGRGGEAAPAPARGFWALSDVSFAVRPGEALGIIGPNGAGKSTILKVVTGILEPTHGRREISGRVGALIELAAGFHGDLTGRENVFLQGSFMGMQRREIARKFDQIVDFADIDEFIDTPVKRYSSGMNARLGFAIAAHLDPDVLIIDEVLAVGDAAFQKKAFARVKELVRGDIPVIVVSHQLEQLAELCTHAVVLERGRVVRRGTPRECITSYLESVFTPRATRGSGGAIEIQSLASRTGTTVASGQRIVLTVQCSVRDPERTRHETVAIRLRAPDGAVLFTIDARRLGAGAPDESLWYWFDVAIQLNVPPNSYVVESLVWHDEACYEMETGPTLGVTVTPGAPFSGPVQPNARAWIAYAQEFGEERGWVAPGAMETRAAVEAEARGS
jgi:ABC-type polysaccharide/polyol phosphate transport system ATPase subunit